MPSNSVVESRPDPRDVLTTAVGRAAQVLGLSRRDLGRVLGRDRSALSRGIDPDSKPGELALLLVRCYRDLAVLVGEDRDAMRHWFTTRNGHTEGFPGSR